MLTIGFGSTALSFCFEFSQIWGYFCTFWAFWGYIWGWVRLKKIFGTYLHRLATFILEVWLYLASLKLSRVGGGGWLGVVGKSDFNENPVVSLDLDFDLGFVNSVIIQTMTILIAVYFTC